MISNVTTIYCHLNRFTFMSAVIFLIASAVLIFFQTSAALSQEPLPWHKDKAYDRSAPGQNPMPPDDRYNNDQRPRYERNERRPLYNEQDRPNGYRDGYSSAPRTRDNSYSTSEISHAGHKFFGTVSSGLAKVIEYAFSQNGRPNGYILGEEAGGAIVAGLRYGEGILYTKDAGRHRVFWQGPSIGYDFGAEGSKTMILVYNLYSPDDIYGTFAGVSGSAYLVGGVGITFQTREHVTLAPIRAGLGARLGANVGYLKYTRRPTWNPF